MPHPLISRLRWATIQDGEWGECKYVLYVDGDPMARERFGVADVWMTRYSDECHDQEWMVDAEFTPHEIVCDLDEAIELAEDKIADVIEDGTSTQLAWIEGTAR